MLPPDMSTVSSKLLRLSTNTFSLHFNLYERHHDWPTTAQNPLRRELFVRSTGLGGGCGLPRTWDERHGEDEDAEGATRQPLGVTSGLTDTPRTWERNWVCLLGVGTVRLFGDKGKSPKEVEDILKVRGFRTVPTIAGAVGNTTWAYLEFQHQSCLEWGGMTELDRSCSRKHFLPTNLRFLPQSTATQNRRRHKCFPLDPLNVR